MLMEVFMWKLVPHSPPCASASLPLTLPLCCSERCSVRVRVMSSTLDAPYTWGKTKKGLKDSSGLPALAPKGFLNSSCKEGPGAGDRGAACSSLQALEQVNLTSLIHSLIHSANIYEESLCAGHRGGHQGYSGEQHRQT